METKPFQVWGLDSEIGDTEATYQAGFESREEAEEYLAMARGLGLTGLEIRECKS